MSRSVSATDFGCLSGEAAGEHAERREHTAAGRRSARPSTRPGRPSCPGASGSTVAVREDSSSSWLRSCSVGDLTCDQAASSSIASGSPPTRRHSSVTASFFLGERCVAHSGGAVGEQLVALRQRRQRDAATRTPRRAAPCSWPRQSTPPPPTSSASTSFRQATSWTSQLSSTSSVGSSRIALMTPTVGSAPPPGRQTQGPGDPTRHITRPGRYGEVDPHAILIAESHLRRQPRLPSPAQTDHGDESTRLKQTTKRSDLGTPSNEPGRIARRPDTSRTGRAAPGDRLRRFSGQVRHGLNSLRARRARCGDPFSPSPCRPEPLTTLTRQRSRR